MFCNLLLSISVTILFFFFYLRCPEPPCQMIILSRPAEKVNYLCICICCVAEDRAEA